MPKLETHVLVLELEGKEGNWSDVMHCMHLQVEFEPVGTVVGNQMVGVEWCETHKSFKTLSMSDFILNSGRQMSKSQ